MQNSISKVRTIVCVVFIPTTSCENNLGALSITH